MQSFVKKAAVKKTAAFFTFVWYKYIVFHDLHTTCFLTYD